MSTVLVAHGKDHEAACDARDTGRECTYVGVQDSLGQRPLH